jgi:hypothetical protein
MLVAALHAEIAPGARDLHWWPADAVHEEQRCRGDEPIDWLAARGSFFAERCIASRIGGVTLLAERQLLVEALTVPRKRRPYDRRNRRIEDLVRRARSARSVAWEPRADGRCTLVLELHDGARTRSVITPEEAEIVRLALAP